MPRDLVVPEIAFDELGLFRQRAQLQRALLFGGIPREHVS
jgi:hypothetical protein